MINNIGNTISVMIKESKFVQETDINPPAKVKINTTAEINITVHAKSRPSAVEKTSDAAFRYAVENSAKHEITIKLVITRSFLLNLCSNISFIEIALNLFHLEATMNV